MSCTKEEIERKRLEALQRKKEAQSKHGPTPNTSSTSSAISSSNRFSPYAQTNNKYINNVRNERSYDPSPKKGIFNQRKENIAAVNTQKFFGQKQVITGTCSMISNSRFQVEVSSFLSVLIQAFKTIPDKIYDVQTKIWNFPLKEYDLFMKKMIDFKSNVQIVGLPKIVLETFRKSLLDENKTTMVDLSNVDPILVNSLMPFQYEGVCYGVSKGGRCMIADDMGLGKTIQALGIAHYFKDSWPLLIVAPSSVRYAWSNAILEFLPSVPTMLVHQFLNCKDSICEDKIVIVSYDLLARNMEMFEAKNFGFVILDESHTLKSIKTARFKAVESVTHRTRHIVLLSGTPLLSRPMELYSQIKLILPNFMLWKDYGIRYCAGKRQPFGWDFSGSSNMHELQLLLKHTCVIRRLKTNVLKFLPTKRREVITLNPELIKAGTEDMERMALTLQRSGTNGIERHSALLQYYNESAVAKQKAICDYVSKLFKSRRKCLLYAHHHNVLNAICEVAESMKIKYIRIDGKTVSGQRSCLVNRFQTDDDCLGAVLSITAASTGITLTAAQLVVFAELFWNPGVLCQAEDRVHRIGQNDDVVIQYLIAKHTVDDFLWPIIQEKIRVLNEIGLEHDFSLNKVSSATQEDRKQGNLDSFVTTEDSSQQQSDKQEKDELQKGSISFNGISDMSGMIDELQQFNEEDFMCREEDFCDWDSVP